jgi:hypothetical protein
MTVKTKVLIASVQEVADAKIRFFFHCSVNLSIFVRIIFVINENQEIVSFRLFGDDSDGISAPGFA